MEIKELYNQLKYLIENGHGSEKVVVEITPTEPTLGATPTVEVKDAHLGFDWNSGKFLLTTKTPVNQK